MPKAGTAAIPRSFGLVASLALFLLTTLGVGISQTDLITTAVYQSNGSEAWPNQKSIAVGSDGFVRFVIGDSSSEGWMDEITYVRCLDENCSASNTSSFATGGYTWAYSIALGPDGYARIAYSSNNSPPEGHDSSLGFIQCSDNDCGSFTKIVAAGASNDDVSSIAVGSDGTSYIVYDDGNDEDGQGVAMATCSGTSCSTTHIADISIYDVIGGAIALDQSGNPVIAYIDDAYPDTPSVHYYANDTDTVISNDVGGYDQMDMSVAPDGFARIIFPNIAGDGVNFAQCTNASCSSHNISTISPSGFGSGYASGAVGQDGNPEIEISLRGGSSVDIVNCTSTDCSSYSDEPLSGDWQNVASLVLGTDGFARMLAQDTDYVAYQVRRPTVTITQRTSGTVSTDNAAYDEYDVSYGTTNLGIQANINSCFAGMEFVGSVSPSTVIV